MRCPIVIQDRKLYVCDHRVHHVWIGLAYALTDIRDWRDWWPDLRRKR